MRVLLPALVILTAPAQAQDAPSCASLLTAAEIQSACGVAVAVEVSEGATGCSVAAQRSDSASQLIVTLAVQESAEAAAATVEVGRAMGRAADADRAQGGDAGDADGALGGVLGALGMQDADAPEAEALSAEALATRELPDLGDGGVRYVTEATQAIGLLTHTVVFSSGPTVAKLESAEIAGRAGVCTVETLEPLARRVADRMGG